MQVRLFCPDNFDNWIARYEAGEAFPKLAKECGVSPNVFRRWLTESNVHVRTITEGQALASTKRKDLIGRRMDIDAAVARYRQGASMLELESIYGVSRETIKTAFVARGVVVRNRSEAERLSWQKGIKTADRQTAAAWDAIRGKPIPESVLITSAKGKAKSLVVRGRWEQDITESLRGRGLSVIPQYPAGRYNLDIAIESPLVAIEVYGSTPNPRVNSKFAERSQYLFDRGWWLLMIVDCRTWFNLPALTDKVVAFVELAREDESPICKHGVIRGDGQLSTGRCSKIDYLARVESF